MARPLQSLQIFSQNPGASYSCNLLFVWPSGDTTYLQFRKNFELEWDGNRETGPAFYVLPCRKDHEHDELVIDTDFSESMRIHCSVDSSGLIKIWNEKRHLIREIKFDQEFEQVKPKHSEKDKLPSQPEKSDFAERVTSVTFFGSHVWHLPAPRF